jgi:hypothetical protein
MNKLPSMSFADPDYNKRAVVFIGATGSAKSTTLNMMYGRGDPAKAPFKEGEEMNPCTQLVQKRDLEEKVKNKTIQVIDTPGLNDEHDFELQVQVMRELSTIKTLSAAVLCVNYTQKETPEFKNTLNFYRRVLQPLFHERRVWILFTWMSSTTYRDYVYFNELDSRLAKFKLAMETNHKLHFAAYEFAGRLSRMDQERTVVLEKYRNMTKPSTFVREESKQGPAFKKVQIWVAEESLIPLVERGEHEKNCNDIALATLFALDRLKTFVAINSPVKFLGDTFELPPAANSWRNNILRLLVVQEETTGNVVAVENEQRGLLVKEKTRLNTEISDAENLLTSENQNLTHLQGKRGKVMCCLGLPVVVKK